MGENPNLPMGAFDRMNHLSLILDILFYGFILIVVIDVIIYALECWELQGND